MKPRSNALKLTILLVSSLTILSVITISPALPSMAQAFPDVHNIEFISKLVLTITALFIALTSMIAGVLIDKYGRLRMLWLGMVLYALSGSAGFWLDDIYHILVSRALLGIAVGISMTIVTTLIADYFEGAQRQKFVGIQIAFMSLGGILFLALGGFLADVSWRHPFLIYLLAIALLPLVFMYLEEPEIHHAQGGDNSKLKSPNIIWLLLFNTSIMWIVFFLIPVQIPFQLKDIGVSSNALIGLAVAMSTAASAVSSFSYSKLKDRLSFQTIFCLGYLFMAVAYVLVYISGTYAAVAMAMLVAGFGMGMMIPNTNMWVMKIAPPQIRGREIGRLTTFWFMGQFLSPIIIQPLSTTMTVSAIFGIAAIFLGALAVGFLILRLTMSSE
jgi:MFS family permease